MPWMARPAKSSVTERETQQMRLPSVKAQRERSRQSGRPKMVLMLATGGMTIVEASRYDVPIQKPCVVSARMSTVMVCHLTLVALHPAPAYKWPMVKRSMPMLTLRAVTMIDESSATTMLMMERETMMRSSLREIFQSAAGRVFGSSACRPSSPCIDEFNLSF